MFRSFPSRNEIADVTFVLDAMKPSSCDEANRIIVPEFVAETDDHAGSRMTVNLRKCVAQEMHGS